ncbi:MAG: chorismate synthase [Candidatus Wallbacteria bacterium]|nr:chorismate synthase [Candidatus Wallbacteria bacterium]
MLRFLTAGESHGTGLTVIVEGLPAGLPVSAELIDNELRRRQLGYGRGKRMEIEHDAALIQSGVRNGLTLGSPVSIFIQNLDHGKWTEIMKVSEGISGVPVTLPRPGHADLAATLKYGFTDIRNSLERASARETAARVAAGAVFKQLLSQFGITVSSHTVKIVDTIIREVKLSFNQAEDSLLRCLDPDAELEMISAIDNAAKSGDSLGGVSEISAAGMIPGLGSHVHFDRRLDSRIAAALMSIPSVKGVEIGPAFENAGKCGSEVHDEIFHDRQKGFFRRQNRAGGVEGGISNGEPIVVRLAVKPIPTLQKPLATVDIKTLEPGKAFRDRADTCVVPAVGVIGEAMLAYVLADAFLEKFGCDCLEDIKKAYDSYLKRIASD